MIAAMARTARASRGGVCYHVLNRGNGQAEVFHDQGDFGAFVGMVAEACERVRMSVLAYCVMPTHFHFCLRPLGNGDLGRWMQWLMTAHVRRYHKHHGTSGHVWQGRYKAFPIQEDGHLLAVLRYVERNPLRAGLVAQAQDWPWSSLRWWGRSDSPSFLAEGPVAKPQGWIDRVNRPQSEAEEKALRLCIQRNRPFGTDSWVALTAADLGLESSVRPRGRPKKGVGKKGTF